ncbi:MAG: hypothetical protein K8W52_46710 [Deltaproteobacteria bacterium]|nr:hypothetical protein [Deltaproteobacteria bacterium]
MKRLRVVSYAINGRGVGHLVRQLAILRWVRRYAALLGVQAECWVLTTSEADTLARREGFAAFKLPSKAMMRDAQIDPTRWLAVARGWVLNAVAGIAPDVILVDTFPGGSFGELVSVLELVPQRVLVARAVKDEIAGDDAYRGLVPMYQTQIVPDDRGVGPILLREREELLDRAAARTALGVPEGARAVYVTLGGGGDEAAPRTLAPLCDALVARGWHVVVGAGPLYLGPERRGANITWMDRYVPMELFQGFDAAVSAGGYNSVNELMFAGVPTVFLPQPRLADDQEGRAAMAAAAGAGRLAPTLEAIPDLLEAPGDAACARALVPHNGARAAAAAVLATVLPAADVAMAKSVLTPSLWAAAHRAAGTDGVAADRALDLVRAVVGESPSALEARDAMLAELVADGALVASPPRRQSRAAARVERLLAVVTEARVPADLAATLLRTLRRKFPAASLDATVDAIEVLFPAWARFADWMGAVALINALPVQRSYAIGEFAAATAAWLGREDDLFDALRRFARSEGGGARPVAEVLRALGEGPR